jgi:hypothetical protein
MDSADAVAVGDVGEGELVAIGSPVGMVSGSGSPGLIGSGTATGGGRSGPFRRPPHAPPSASDTIAASIAALRLMRLMS